MFRISAETEYGYVALIQLARSHGSKVATKLSEIVGGRNLSEKFMLQVLTDLRRAGLVASRRGKSGGYTLSYPPNKITLADLLAATGGEAGEDSLAFDIAGPGSCLAKTLRQSHAQFLDAMRSITLEEAMAEEDRGGAMMYHI